MKFKVILFTLWFTIIQGICLHVYSNTVNLSSNAQFSLLTCSNGDELYSTFGHSALRVFDDSLNIDVVFNYGTFDFNTPHFYLKFVNGQLDYLLSTTTYKYFLLSYQHEQRSVVESIINLTPTEKQEFWNRLVTNMLPENRAYRYDFFFDNCATRIRDIFFDIKGLDKSKFLENEGKTFRDYLHECLPINTWTSQGIDLILGADCDNIASIYDRAYLPIYLNKLFTDKQFVDSQQIVVNYNSNGVNNSLFTPFNCGILLLLLTLILTCIEFRKHIYFRWFDVILFSIASLLSVLFWYLWIVSDLQACSYNTNVLWASIFYIPLFILLLKNKKAKFPYALTIILIVASDFAFILLSIFEVQFATQIAYLFMTILFFRTILILKRK